MICKNCSGVINDNSQFCCLCGSQIENPTQENDTDNSLLNQTQALAENSENNKKI